MAEDSRSPDDVPIRASLDPAPSFGPESSGGSVLPESSQAGLPLELRPLSRGYRRERATEYISYGLVGILFGTIAATFLYATWGTEHVEGAVKLAQIIIPAITTLVASVVSFYFGTQSKD
jgi:H+/Cl- antiporter ClcA